MVSANKKVVVVIPIHSESVFELISFQQCFKILSNHSIKIVAPEVKSGEISSVILFWMLFF
jgi:hypothetical protein